MVIRCVYKHFKCKRNNLFKTTLSYTIQSSNIFVRKEEKYEKTIFLTTNKLLLRPIHKKQVHKFMLTIYVHLQNVFSRMVSDQF